MSITLGESYLLAGCEFSSAQEPLVLATGEGNSSIRGWRGSEKCGGLRRTAWHKMEVIAGFFGSGMRAAQFGLGAAFSHYFKKLTRLAKLATSYIVCWVSNEKYAQQLAKDFIEKSAGHECRSAITRAV